jgi:hypothetical protein
MTSPTARWSGQNTKESVMDVLLIIAIVLGGLVLFDALAMRFGVDSREGLGDDWARPIRG